MNAKSASHTGCVNSAKMGRSEGRKAGQDPKKAGRAARSVGRPEGGKAQHQTSRRAAEHIQPVLHPLARASVRAVILSTTKSDPQTWVVGRSRVYAALRKRSNATPGVDVSRPSSEQTHLLETVLRSLSDDALRGAESVSYRNCHVGLQVGCCISDLVRDFLCKPALQCVVYPEQLLPHVTDPADVERWFLGCARVLEYP